MHFLKFFRKNGLSNRLISSSTMADADMFDATTQTDGEGAISASLTTEERVATLYESHREEIYRFLVGQGLASATAQELTQDVFVKLFVAVSKNAEIVSEQAWLYGVASKLAVDYWRREGRAMWVELDSSPELAETLRSKELTPEAAASRGQRLQRVAAVLARLPKEQRLGVHLRLQGLRYRAIAKILGVSVSTTANLLSTAVERLRSTANE
jgi:RNA polymerase sigma-70 factor (ECF subfamily)